MYALVAYKRRLTLAGQPDRFQVGIDKRSFGCFNGFNTQNAFSARGAEVWDLVADVREDGYPLETRGTYSRGYISGAKGAMETTLVREGWRIGEWETLAIGYITYTAGATTGKLFNEFTPQNITGNTRKGDASIGKLLQREGFQDHYYDAYDGSARRTTRVLTPNEQFLSNFCQYFQSGRLGWEYGIQRGSCLAVSMQANRYWGGCLYQFVGSERSSGQAVSYLQTYRNVAEQNANGWEAKGALWQFLAQTVTRNISADQSVIALLSYFINNGSDSDNITFAGLHYISYCMRVGFWKTADLYRNTESMLVEGRYNKGGQSDAIRVKLNTKKTNNRELAGLWHERLGRCLEDINGSFTALVNIQSYTQPQMLQQYRNNRQTLVTRFGQALDSYFAVDAPALFNAYCAAFRALPDLTVVVPHVPTTRADGAAQGFVAWVTQTAEQIQTA